VNTPLIVVLDGHAANPGDLSWDELHPLGQSKIYERTPAHLTVERAGNAEIVLTNKVILDRPTILQLPKLRYIGVMATGYNVVDCVAAKERGIIVTNVPAYSTMSVAQLTFALLLELTHHVGDHSRGVREGQWSKCPDFAYWETPLIELDGLTMGIIGYGSIGRKVAGIAESFGMNVLFHSRAAGVDLETLLRQSDVVSLHCPLTDQTRHLINAARLALMKPSAFLINTGRGPLVHESDLAAALHAGKIAGAAVDVLSVEPPPSDNPLLRAPNCIITPHFGWATKAARQRLMRTVAANIRAHLAGSPQNVVS
jgi:glycerate dehydrogenase